MSAKSKHVLSAENPAGAALRPEQEKLVRKLLIDGATFEDVVLTLAAQGHRVPQHVVENYFRSDPELPALRASCPPAPGLSSMKAHGVSPHFSSGLATTAA